MSANEEAIKGLRAALDVSPENIPLRIHLAQTLQRYGFFDDAEQEYRQALSLQPENIDVKLGLIQLYSSQNKTGQAIVIAEAMCQKPNPPSQALIAYAKLLFRDGEVQSAVARYKQALEIDPENEDAELSEQLGIGAAYQDSFVQEGRVRESVSANDSVFDAEIEKPEIRFRDVGGMEDTKEEISVKILYPLKHPEMYAAYGKKVGGGILMYGPPGCGKTYLARATAGEIDAGFISVGISDVLDMWSGQSERNLTSLFDQARANAPCVLFFDEVDALGGRRSDMRNGSGRNLINQFLSEMDGVGKSNDGVLVLAATNAPWHVDAAFRRPGRFDRVVFVSPPDAPGLAEVLRIHLEGKPQVSIDHSTIAKKMKGFSGADVKAVVEQAIESKLRDAMKSGIPEPISTKDLLAAAKKMKPTTHEWFSTAKNYATYSNQGGIYDDVLKYLNR